MKTEMYLLGALFVTCAVTLGSGRKPNPVAASDAQDYGCAALFVNVPPRARPMGVVQIPSPAANFLAIGLWARDRWHGLWGEPLDRQECVASPSADREGVRSGGLAVPEYAAYGTTEVVPFPRVVTGAAALEILPLSVFCSVHPRKGGQECPPYTSTLILR